MLKKRLPDLIALVLAFLMGFGNIFNVVFAFLRTPLGTQYSGIGTLYVADYLNYLVVIAQGMRGSWQFQNLYTQEATAGNWVVDWPYLLIGHLCRMFSISAQAGYWIAVFFLTVGIVFGAYLFLKMAFKKNGKTYLVFPVLIVYLISGPFIWIDSLRPFLIEIRQVTWYYQADFFERVSVMPHHLLANFCVLIFFLISLSFFETFKEKKYTIRSLLATLGMTFILLIVMSINPIVLLYLLPALGASFIYGIFFFKVFNFKNVMLYFFSLAAMVVILFIFGLYFQNNVSVTYYPEIVAWERSMMQWPTLKNFFILSGLVSVLVVPSLFILIKDFVKTKIHPAITLGVCASLLSYIFFYTRISLLFNNHNSRFLFPDAYLFMSIVIFLAVDKIRTKCLQGKFAVCLATFLIVLISFPSFYLVLKQRSSPGMTNEGFEEFLTYLPDEVIKGMKFLEDNVPENSLILTSPFSNASFLPSIFAQVRVYAVRPLVTINYPRKAGESRSFFSNYLNEQQKIDFLHREKIDYVVFSVYDLGPLDKSFFENPLFLSKALPLKLVFANSMVLVYKVN